MEQSERKSDGEGYSRPRIGIITALAKEHAAVCAMLDNRREVVRAGRPYEIGSMPARSGAPHTVVVGLLPTAGNNIAGIVSTILALDFPSVQDLIVVGIAGAAPNPRKPDQHVRLGDVVATGERGIVQYDHVKRLEDEQQHRAPPRAPSFRLLMATRILESERRQGLKPWLAEFNRTAGLAEVARPTSADRLRETPPATDWVEHPVDPGRVEGEPRVFMGTIGSANIVLADAVYRDKIRDKFDLRAFEMEVSGLADASWVLGREYFAVRGTCDYCDGDKNDIWQGYASAIAAAYARALLAATDNAVDGLPETASPIEALSHGVQDWIKPIRTKRNRYLRWAIAAGTTFAAVGWTWPNSATPLVAFVAGSLLVFFAFRRDFETAHQKQQKVNSVLRSLGAQPPASDFARIAREVAELLRR